MNNKELFLKNDFIDLLKKLKASQKGKWGIMNAQQMVEHFCEAVRNAKGKLILPLLNKGEVLEKFRNFLMSEKPFRENTDNPLVPKEGSPLNKPDLESAINKLQKELNYFFELFEKHPELKTTNAFFGDLNYAMNVQLLHKHAEHHLRQFGLIQ